MNIGKEITGLLEQALKEQGRDLGKSSALVADYARQRANHLAQIHGQPGWERAVKAEAESVLAYGTLQMVDEADAADARLLGILEGTLGLCARLVAGGVL